MRTLFLLWSRYNPTASLLRMKSFVARHDYIFSLLLLLNVNMDAFDITALCDDEDEDGPLEEDDQAPYLAMSMLREVSRHYSSGFAAVV